MTSGIGSPGRSLFHRVRALTLGRAVDRWSSHAALVSATQGFGLLVKPCAELRRHLILPRESSLAGELEGIPGPRLDLSARRT
jgi:hypothetical protein